MLVGRRKGKTVEAEESEEMGEEGAGKKTPQRRTSRNLVAKKKMSGGANIGKGRKSRKGGYPQQQVQEKRYLSRKTLAGNMQVEEVLQELEQGVSSINQDIMLSMTRVRSSTSMAIRFLEMMRSRLRGSRVKGVMYRG